MSKFFVSNMISSRGNSIPNQFSIAFDEKICFQSYGSQIAEIDYTDWGKATLTIYKPSPEYFPNGHFTNTTTKYLRQFLFDNCNAERVPAILKEAKKALAMADSYTTTDF